MKFKLADSLLPCLVVFGPLGLMSALPTSSLWYIPITGPIMMAIGGFLILSKMRRLEQRIEELEKRDK